MSPPRARRPRGSRRSCSTAGLLVAAGALSLLAGEMEFFRVFGPGSRVAALVVTLVCVTLVPALMALLGPRLFGRRAARCRAAASPLSPCAEPRRTSGRECASPACSERCARAAAPPAPRPVGRCAFVARLLATRPVAPLLAVVCVAVLLVAATGVRSIDLARVVHPVAAGGQRAAAAGDAAAAAFVPGIVAPTEVVLEQPGHRRAPGRARRAAATDRQQPGIAAVLGPAQAAGTRSAPRRRRRRRRRAVRRADARRADRRRGDRRVRAPAGPHAGARASAPGCPDARVSYAGETALAPETVESLAGDLWRVALVTAVVMFVLLAIFLRALVAPLLLLAGSVLAFAASFGAHRAAAPAARRRRLRLLRAAGRRRDARRPRLGLQRASSPGGSARRCAAAGMREAIAVAAPAASRAITVAGITLAATFALLAIVPLRPFRELALLMTLGVLIDALFVRPLLIPALIALAGRATWWPSRLRRRAVGPPSVLRGGTTRCRGDHLRDARHARRADPRPRGAELARQLPASLRDALAASTGSRSAARVRRARGRPRRVGKRPRRSGASVVIAVLVSVLADGEIEYLAPPFPATTHGSSASAPQNQKRRGLDGGARRPHGRRAPRHGTSGARARERRTSSRSSCRAWRRGCRPRRSRSATRQGQRRVRRGVPELGEGLGAEVGHVVAGLVVAGVVGHSRGAAVDRRLLLRLDPLGAGEETTGRDARAMNGP